MNPLVQQLHALLFLSGSPVSTARLTKLTNSSAEEVATALLALSEFLTPSGVMIRTTPEGTQLITSPEVAEVTARFVQSAYETNLSKTALEALTIILYKGPVTRPAIDYIRGMNSQYALQTLLVRGIIERHDNPKDARSYVYTVAPKFLDHLGITDSTQIPEFTDLHTRDDESIATALADIENESKGSSLINQ